MGSFGVVGTGDSTRLQVNMGGDTDFLYIAPGGSLIHKAGTEDYGDGVTRAEMTFVLRVGEPGEDFSEYEDL